MTQGVPHDETTKAAVLAALLTGQSVSAVARDFKISRSTIQVWRAAAGLTNTAPVDQQKRHEIGELVANYLRQNLTTLAVQAEQFRDTNWLRKQDASSVAVLHGVLCDKSIRLLEALSPEPNDASEEEDA